MKFIGLLGFLRALEALGFPGGSVVKNLHASEGDIGSIPGWEDIPEKEMTTLSSIIAWKTPQTEEPGRLQSTGLQRIRHNLTTKQQLGTVPSSKY